MIIPTWTTGWTSACRISIARCVPSVVVAAALALACGAAYAASNCKLAKIIEWEVKPQAGLLIVEGAINGQKVGVLLDTGAVRSFLLRATADRLGLTRYEARGYRTFGVGGETHAEYTLVDELKLGDGTRKNWRVLVVGEQDARRPFDVLLGYDFFEHADVEFDLANRAVRVFQAVDCKDVSLAYWAKGGASVVNLEIDNARPGILVPVKLNGEPLLADLDSGAGRTVVSQRIAANLGIRPDSPQAKAAGQARGLGPRRPDDYVGAFESFAIGDEVVRNPNIHFTDLDASTIATGTRLSNQRELRDMLLGMDFLRAHRVFVAHSQGKIYFTYVGGRVFDAPPRAAPAK